MTASLHIFAVTRLLSVSIGADAEELCLVQHNTRLTLLVPTYLVKYTVEDQEEIKATGLSYW